MIVTSIVDLANAVIIITTRGIILGATAPVVTATTKAAILTAIIPKRVVMVTQ